MTTSQKQNLLLLPGLLNDARLWQYQIAALSDVAHATVADLTGADSMAALASAALAQAPAERFALAGLSMGGYVALEIMRQAPDRVMALALLDTSARPDTPQATETRVALMRLSKKHFSHVIDLSLPRAVHPTHLTDTSIVKVIREMSESAGKEVFVRQQQAVIERIDSRPSLHRITCPTLILCGRDDVVTPVDAHEEMAAAIPASRLVIIDECGHLSTLEAPQKVTDALRKWLSDIHD